MEPVIDYPVLHLVEDTIVTHSKQKSQQVKPPPVKGFQNNTRNKIIKKPTKIMKEDWVVKRRSERVFIKDSQVNYEEPQDNDDDEVLSSSRPHAKSTYLSIPISSLGIQNVKKITEHFDKNESNDRTINESENIEEKTEFTKSTITSESVEGKGSRTEQDKKGSSLIHPNKCSNRSAVIEEREKKGKDQATEGKYSNNKNKLNLKSDRKAVGLGEKLYEKKSCPVCLKSYTMNGRGKSYFKEHLMNYHQDERHNDGASETVSLQRENKDIDMLNTTNDKVCHNRHVKTLARNEKGYKVRDVEESTEREIHSQEVKTRQRNARSKTFKFKYDLGLFDLEGAKAGLVRMTNEPDPGMVHSPKQGKTKGQEKQHIFKEHRNENTIKDLNIDELMSPEKEKNQEKHLQGAKDYQERNRTKAVDIEELMSDPEEYERNNKYDNVPDVFGAEKLDTTKITNFTNFIKVDSKTALVPQIRLLSSKLPTVALNSNVDLSLDFPSLMSTPDLENIIHTFLRLVQELIWGIKGR